MLASPDDQKSADAQDSRPVSGTDDESVVPTAKEDLAKQDDAQMAKSIGIDWESDPHNPRTWSKGRKWTMAAIVSLYTLVAPLASSMLAPGLPQMAEHYRITSATVVALILSVFLLGFAIGPLVYGPLSEMYGRTWVLHASTAFFFVFNTACIFAPNTASVIVFRFFAGLGGSAAVSIGGGSIADLFHENERAMALGVYSAGPLIGPVIGPVAGGFIVANVGFKYVFVVVSSLAGVALALGIVVLRETYAPVIIERLAKRRAADEEKRGEKPEAVPEEPDFWELLKVNLSRPMYLLTHSLICFSLSLYMALVYGYLYLLFTTFPTVYAEQYGWGTGVSGLAYLGPGIGFLISTIGGAKLMDRIYFYLIKRNNGVAKPEFRIPGMFIGSLFVPIGLFWYGWSAAAKIHWIMPIIGGGFFGLGMMLAYLPIVLYLVDSFKYAASAVAAASVLRSFFGFVFPLFGQKLFETLGVGGGNSLLGGLAILLGCPFPIWIFFYGERIRARSDLNR